MQTRKDIRNFYIDEAFLPIWEEFKQICTREGDSASEKIREFIERYVIVHSGGNPQLRIDKFTGKIDSKTCFFCQGHFPQLYKVKYASGLVAPTCQTCLDQNKAKGTFSTVKRVLGLIE
jgi:hypothetical protein